jgi:hypothetical protein
MSCHLKDWRRLTTRFDRNIKNFMAAIALVAAVIWWLRGRTLESGALSANGDSIRLV